MSDAQLEKTLITALRSAVPHVDARRAIMRQVRMVPSQERPRRSLALYGRAMRQSLIGLAFAAGIGSLTTLSALAPASVSTVRGAGVVSTVVIGDTVVNRVRDTLRLVRLIFHDSTAQRVAVVGEFNAWDEGATQLTRDARTGRWTTTLALHDGEHRYAILVDNTRRPGLLHVTRTN